MIFEIILLENFNYNEKVLISHFKLRFVRGTKLFMCLATKRKQLFLRFTNPGGSRESGGGILLKVCSKLFILLAFFTWIKISVNFVFKLIYTEDFPVLKHCQSGFSNTSGTKDDNLWQGKIFMRKKEKYQAHNWVQIVIYSFKKE